MREWPAGDIREGTRPGTCDVTSWDKGRENEMKCHRCGTDMKAVTYNSDGYGKRLMVGG